MRVDGVESKVVTIAKSAHDEEETSKDIEIEDDGQDGKYLTKMRVMKKL